MQARKVITFWLEQEDASDVHARLASAHAWGLNLSSMIRRNYPQQRMDPVLLEAEGRWGSAGEMASVFQGRKAAVEAMCASVSGELSLSQARAVHDAAMTCKMFGYLPPLRMCIIRTLIGWGQVVFCGHEDCRHRGTVHCRGNKVLLRPDGVVHLDMPHHKTESSVGTLRLELPAELGELVKLYFSRAYPVLRAAARGDVHPFMFMNAYGGAFTESCLSGYFKGLMEKWGAPCIAPQRLRHSFVDALMSTKDSVPRPGLRGSARAMGTSVQQFRRHYDPRVSDREAQEAVQSMGAFRESLVSQWEESRRVAVAPPPSLPCAQPAVEDDDDDDAVVIELE